VFEGVYIDCVEHLLLLLLHLHCNVEAPAGPAVHLYQENWLNVLKSAILCKKNTINSSSNQRRKACEWKACDLRQS